MMISAPSYERAQPIVTTTPSVSRNPIVELNRAIELARDAGHCDAMLARLDVHTRTGCTAAEALRRACADDQAARLRRAAVGSSSFEQAQPRVPVPPATCPFSALARSDSAMIGHPCPGAASPQKNAGPSLTPVREVEIRQHIEEHKARTAANKARKAADRKRHARLNWLEGKLRKEREILADLEMLSGLSVGAGVDVLMQRRRDFWRNDDRKFLLGLASAMALTVIGIPLSVIMVVEALDRSDIHRASRALRRPEANARRIAKQRASVAESESTLRAFKNSAPEFTV